METPSVDYTPRRDATAQRQAESGPLGLFDQILRNRNEGGSVSTEPTDVRPTKDRGAPAERSQESPVEADQPEVPEASADDAAAAPEVQAERPQSPATAEAKGGAATSATVSQQPQPAGQPEPAAAGQADPARNTSQTKDATAAVTAPSAAKDPVGGLGQGLQPQAGDALKATPDLRGAVQSATAALAGTPVTAASQAAGPKPLAGPNTAGPNPATTAAKPSGQRGMASTTAGPAPGSKGAERAGLAPETAIALSLEAQQGRPGDPAVGDLENVNGLRPAAGLAGAPVGVTDLAGLARTPTESRGSPTAQVAVQIKRAVATGNDRISIRLHPAELGRVQVRLEVAEDGHVRALISAERAETLDLMQRDPRGLERALQDAGLKTDSGSLSFTLQDQQGEAFQSAEEQHRGGPEDGERRSASDREAAQSQTLYWSAGDGRLDIRI